MKHNVWLVLAAAIAAFGCEKANQSEGIPAMEQSGENMQRGNQQQRGQMQREQQGTQRDQQAMQREQRQQQGTQQRQASQRQQGMQQEVQQNARIDVRRQEPYGQYLVDSQGRTLYMFTADTQRRSSDCYEECAEMWPPVLTRQEPQAAGREVQREMLGTIDRRDGTKQVTYGGWPLYTYARDTRPGQVTGQDVHGFGGEWYLMGPDGQRIRAERQQQRSEREQPRSERHAQREQSSQQRERSAQR